MGTRHCRIILTFLMLISTSSMAKEDNIGSYTYLAGKIVDTESQEPISNVLVSLTVKSRWLIDMRTNSDGWYETPGPVAIESLQKGVRVLAIKPGYSAQSLTIGPFAPEFLEDLKSMPELIGPKPTEDLSRCLN